MHWHKRSVNPSATTCTVWKFTQDVSVVSWTGRMWAPTGWSCFLNPSLNTVSLSLKKIHMCTLRHVYTHIFSFQKRQLQSALTNFFFSVSSPISHSLSCLFHTFFFASVSPRAVYYTAKVKPMSPLCLKPNAPVCQRAQLCEEQVNLDFKMWD